MEVSDLWRFQVMSMQGEPFEVAAVDELGIEDDRQWALADACTQPCPELPGPVPASTAHAAEASDNRGQ